MRTLIVCVVALVFCFVQPFAGADEGNGIGGAVLTTTIAPIVPGGGGVCTIDFGQVGGGFGANAFLVLSDGLGPVVDPTAGPICIDLNSPVSQIIATANLGPTQTFPVSFVVPDVPTLPSFPPLYLLNFVFDVTLPFPFLSTSKTVRLSFENVDSYSPSGVMTQARALHTATALGGSPLDDRTRVLVTGGGAGSILSPVATSSSELFDPLTRTWSAGPAMAAARALATATRLPDGRVLVCGGTDNTGAALTSCEIYDPVTNAFTAASSLGTPRVGHAATLLGDGRVLVTGGVTTFAGGQANLLAILNSAQATAELYDPIADLWAPVAGTMSSPRFGHAQVLLNDGRVLVTGGIDGAFNFLNQGVPTYTSTCDFFDTMPAPSFAAAGSLPSARAGHQVTLLGNGDVLSTGGIVDFIFVPTADAGCFRFNGAAWSTVASLPVAVALHAANPTPSGDVVVHGGISGTLLAPSATARVVLHDGTTATAVADIGTNVRNTIAPGASDPRGNATVTPLYDGSFLVTGGSDGSVALAGSYVYTLP